MRRILLLAALLFGSPAGAAGFLELEGSFLELRAMVLSAPPLRGAPRRLTDEASWARLVERARSAPTFIQDLHAGESDFKVYVVVLDTAVAGVQCEGGARPRLALFLAQVVKGPGGEVYPARLTAECVSASLTQLGFAVDADEKGFIKDELLFEPASGRIVNPPQDKLSPAQRARLDGAMADAVRLLLP